MPLEHGGGKIPGKSEFSGRRRTTTRTSGFKSHQNSTGGEFRSEEVIAYSLPAGTILQITLVVPSHDPALFVGFGGWLNLDGKCSVTISGGPRKATLKVFPSPSWSKLGSLWRTNDGKEVAITIDVAAKSKCKVALYEMNAGVVHHEHMQRYADLTDSRSVRLLANIHEVAPEANFYITEGQLLISPSLDSLSTAAPVPIVLKSCNRCARLLPINIGGEDERNHLSFSNHCVAEHRRPCRHGGFGTLKNVDTGEKIQLDYGFQLECRFCKKFEVNAAHNPQRSAAQMKEDAARRRAFELLTEQLLGGSPQLLYRTQTGGELAEVVWNRFNRECFKCRQSLTRANDMNLDHTRPLALLWPLDGTATALCKSCNSEKRDRPPSQFYNAEEIKALSKITGLSVEVLLDPSPNVAALDALEKRLSWFFDVFLTSPEMVKVREGKVTGELLVKALHKVDSLRPGGGKLDLLARYEQLRGK